MIEINAEGMKYAEKALAHIPKKIPKVLARAINSAKDAGKAAAWEKISNDYTIKKKYFTRTFNKGGKATTKTLSAFIKSKGQVNALSYFKTKPQKVPKKRLKNPIFVQIKKTGGGTIKSAFLARMKSGHLGVFHRVNGNKSIPIQQTYGPSIPSMLGTKNVSAFIEERANKVLQECVIHDVNNVLMGIVK